VRHKPCRIGHLARFVVQSENRLGYIAANASGEVLVFFKSARLNFAFSIVLVFGFGIASACSGGGLGCGCTSLPLPAGGLPADQTVEGGAQIRITPAGMQKINTLVTSLVEDSLGSGICVPSGEIGNAHSTFGTGTYYCYQNDDACAPGCDVDITFDALSFGPVNATTLNLHTQFDVDADVPLDYQVIGIGGSCTMHIAADNLVIDANIALSIDATDGELGINLAGINTIDLNLDFSNCGLVSGLLDLIGDVLDFLEDYLGDFINPLLTPLLNDLIQGFLPDPLGIEGMIDIGGLVAGISPGTTGLMEGRIVPGGYVSLNGNGMTLGVITGVNADEDPASRGADVDSEPALCVPPFGPPNFAVPPASLPTTPRSTFTLAAAGAFSGQPDPANDLAMGVSETTLDLFGHHFVTSGGMCLGVGSSFAPALNVSTIGILVQSLAELASNEGNDPLLLVTRPQKPLDFSIGDGSEDNPLLTIHIEKLEVDFYAFLFERFTRVFTLSLTLNAGLNFTVDNSVSPPTLTPVLTGLTSDDIQISVLNSEFVREPAADLEAVLPTVFDLALPMLADGLGPIELPDLGTFSLTDVTLGKVSTTQDDFLAINATLAVGSALRARAATDPHYAAAVRALDAQAPIAAAIAPAAGTARLVEVHTPLPEAIRAALKGGELAPFGEMPRVTIDTDAYDAFGRPLEWGYRLNGGLWRPFTTASPLVIEDRAFAWQGKYTIELRSRVVDDTRTESHDLIAFPVIIDSVAPYIAETMTDRGDAIEITAFDIVSKDELQYAFARPGDDAPATAWQTDATLARTIADAMIDDAKLGVFVRDEAGNIGEMVVQFHGQAGESGCDCSSAGGPPTTGGILLVLLVGGAILVRRRDLRRATAAAIRVAPTVGLWLGISVVVSLAPGCSCSNTPGTQACEDVADCEGFCDGGDIPFCIDGTCVCSDDIPPGRIGPYSDVAAAPDGNAWVSAYASSHGDLVVAHAVTDGRIADLTWQWVDGVPDGPIEIPGAMIRGGISAPGPDVGMYTSIAVAADGSPMVTYFDRSTGSLLFAQQVAGVWQKHVIEAGAGSIEGDGGIVVGMYTSLSARSDDGRPGVAYLKHVNTGGTVHAEVRWASSQSATPTSTADWTFWTVDTADVPAEDPENPDVFPLPGGLGLFVDAARGPDQAPVVVYYDRGAGDLKFARFNVTGGTFDPPTVLDGAASDAGWSPTVGVDAAGVVHVAYVGATYDDLQYIRSDAPGTTEIIDNGYRIVGTTDDGLPKPEFHLVGDDATMVMAPGGPTVVYQDATTHELLLAQRHEGTGWAHLTIAGTEDPFAGAFGFFASGDDADNSIVMSTWVLDQPNSDQWVQVFHTQGVVE
jgi:MYXO-CTERM domain-containing protein